MVEIIYYSRLSEIYEVSLCLTRVYVVKPLRYSGKIIYQMITTEKLSFLSHNVFMCCALFSEYRINTSITRVNRVVFVIERD